MLLLGSSGEFFAFSMEEKKELIDFAVKCINKRVELIMDVYAVGKPFVPFIKEAMVMKNIIDYSVSTKPMPVADEEQKARIREILDWYERG